MLILINANFCDVKKKKNLGGQGVEEEKFIK